jgi:hypothetical protein
MSTHGYVAMFFFVTTLGGVIAALVFRAQLLDLRGKYQLAIVKFHDMDLRQKKAMDTLADFKTQLAYVRATHEEEVNGYRDREAQLRSLLRSCTDPAVVHRRLGELFPSKA